MFVYWLAYSQDIPGGVHLQYNAACFWRGEQDEGKGERDSSLYFYVLNHDVNYSQKTNFFFYFKIKPPTQEAFPDCCFPTVTLRHIGSLPTLEGLSRDPKLWQGQGLHSRFGHAPRARRCGWAGPRTPGRAPTERLFQHGGAVASQSPQPLG